MLFNSISYRSIGLSFICLNLVPLFMAGCQTSSVRDAEISTNSHDDRPSSQVLDEVGHNLVPNPSKDSEKLSLATQHESEEESANEEFQLVKLELNSDEDTSFNELPALEFQAASANPKLRKLQQQTNAAWSKTRHIDKLPDPTVGANVFGHPIETAAGSQRANLTVMQMIPWLDRLNAQEQQACFEAMVSQKEYEAERLRVIGNLRVRYYRLYILTRQIETIEENQNLLESLIEIANARIATGNATQGDVLIGTLELSRLEEQLLALRQQVFATSAEINRLSSRDSKTPISVPDELEVSAPGWSHGMLVQTAFERQPLIAASQLQSQAIRWGVEVAKLRRRPDLQVGASWFFMDDNRPPSGIVDVGRDSWSVGASISIPLDGNRYDAIRDEALWKYSASQSNIVDVKNEFEAQLLDLVEQARSAGETAELYRNTIIPQSEQTLRADQDSLTDGSVEFDRVIQDFRNLLTLEFGYHRAVGELAISIARIRQVVGIDLQSLSPAPAPLPEDGSVPLPQE